MALEIHFMVFYPNGGKDRVIITPVNGWQKYLKRWACAMELHIIFILTLTPTNITNT